jgi:hypothetical protein
VAADPRHHGGALFRCPDVGHGIGDWGIRASLGKMGGQGGERKWKPRAAIFRRIRVI